MVRAALGLTARTPLPIYAPILIAIWIHDGATQPPRAPGSHTSTVYRR